MIQSVKNDQINQKQSTLNSESLTCWARGYHREAKLLTAKEKMKNWVKKRILINFLTTIDKH